MSVRSLMVRLSALATIALLSFTGPLSADPPSGSCEEGEKYCEGCNMCWVEAPHFRIDVWVCDAEGDWGEPNQPGYSSQEQCDDGWEIMGCGDGFEI